MKRFVVGVKNGWFICDNEVRWQYKHYYFETYSEARRFAMRYDKDDRYIMDLERLPF